MPYPVFVRLSAILAAAAVMSVPLASSVLADADCSGVAGHVPADGDLTAFAVPAAGLDAFMNASPMANGMKFRSELRDRDLWLDVVEFPSDTSGLAGAVSLMAIGRVAADEFDRLILADGEEGVFEIANGDLRAVGCRFLWGQETEEAPFAQIVELFQGLRSYEGHARVTPELSGNLMHDMTVTLETHNGPFVDGWLRSAVK
ncbi:hypothetical protein [Defluviimonas salinarum]|uniref:Uncharacterized protein n=1 Tax=Defluviimonas salinarum TaxID=2992147 RepID=A0ABT3J5K2_9RHOB|nr:hypothetical protein [Defluviimonas salinarum]MCW3782974.1 hypothetical protein [Defluviimonas salinarum]